MSKALDFSVKINVDGGAAEVKFAEVGNQIAALGKKLIAFKDAARSAVLDGDDARPARVGRGLKQVACGHYTYVTSHSARVTLAVSGKGNFLNLGMYRQRIYAFATVACLLLFTLLPAHAADPLRLGIMPFNSTLALIKTHAPIRDHLQAKLGRPVEIYTSSDFFTFINESLSGRFDLLLTAPHFGVMSIDKGYVPLVRYRATLESVAVVRSQSGIRSAAALRGKKIGMTSRLAIISIGSVRWLQEQGLQAGRDYQLSEYPTHGAAVAAVAVGEIDAALISASLFKQMPEDVRTKVTTLPTTIKLPHMMLLAHPRLGPRLIESVRAALYDFAETSPEGKVFFAQTAYLGYEPISAADITALRPYIELTRTMMAHP